MIVEFFKKQLGFKIALLVTAVMVFLIGVTLLVIRPFDVHIVSPNSLIHILAIFSLLFLFFQIFLIILSVNHFINQPIHKLLQSMQRVVEGNLNVSCDYQSPDELGELTTNYNKMIMSLHDMNETRKRMEQRLIKAEESLKYKKELEKRAHIIEKMNFELTEAFHDLTLLYTVSQVLNSVLELDELITTVQTIFADHFKCDQFALHFFQPDDQFFQLAINKGFSDKQLSLVQEIIGKVGKNKNATYLNDAALFNPQESDFSDKKIRGALFALPLIVRDELIGVLTVVRSQKDSFMSTDRQALESISSQIAVAYDRSKLYSKTKELSVRDELTGIFNRRYFHQRLDLELKRADRFKRQVSVLMIDVDYFKRFNDTYGHLKGDELLKRLAHLLERNIREIDLLARFGGEEFVVMLADTQINDAVKVANKLRELVVTQLDLSDIDIDINDQSTKETPVTISIGVSAYPLCAQDHDDVINTADMALYMAKKKGRNQVYCYQSDTLPLEEMMTKMGFIH